MSEKTSHTRIQKYAEGRTVVWNKGKHVQWNRKSHDKLLLEHLEKMSNQGFRVIPLLGVLPDGIAIKDGKVYAVELETTSPDYRKYSVTHAYDDVIWIVIPRRVVK
jgi:erythromycin esterase-like protein